MAFRRSNRSYVFSVVDWSIGILHLKKVKGGIKMVELAWYWWAGIVAVIGYLVYYFWNN